MADDAQSDLDPDLDPPERERLVHLGAELDRTRPVPGAAFRGALGRHLLDEGAAKVRHRPRYLWAMVAGLATSGLLLLGLAADSVL
jgi:hypothetical protein